jgi:hypothetical protein
MNKFLGALVGAAALMTITASGVYLYSVKAAANDEAACRKAESGYRGGVQMWGEHPTNPDWKRVLEDYRAEIAECERGQ